MRPAISMAAALCAVLLAPPSVAAPLSDIPPEAAPLVARAFEDCRAAGGDFQAPADSLRRVPLDAQGTEAFLFDHGLLTCAGASGGSPWCGSGGCRLTVAVEGKAWDIQAEGHAMTLWEDRPILLIRRDGGWCGAAGAQDCVEALVWSEGRFLTRGDALTPATLPE